MKLSLLLFTTLLSCGLTFAQKPLVDVTIHSHVDTSQKDIKEIVDLWINYLSSTPDSIYDNPFWNEEEKKKYTDFDFTRSCLYPFPSTQLLNYYKPTILSVEKEGEYYSIKTLFNAEELDGIYKQSNPWCITKLYAVKENKKWKLKNALPILTQHWKRTPVGKITFIYPPEHLFNSLLAEKANKFCDSIAQKFQFPEWQPFDFYISKSGDELGKLLGFDFFFTCYTTGMGMYDRRILLGGFDSEWYPHEFIHLIVPKFKRHGLIEEGFATWNGGQEGKSFEESASLFAKELSKNDTVTFLDVVNKQWGWQYAALYTTGAILCNTAYKKGGIKLVNELLKIPNDSENLVENLCLLFDIEKKDFDNFWRNETKKFIGN